MRKYQSLPEIPIYQVPAGRMKCIFYIKGRHHSIFAGATHSLNCIFSQASKRFDGISGRSGFTQPIWEASLALKNRK